MKKISLTLIILLFLQIHTALSQNINPGSKKINIQFNKNIEFLGFLFYLGWIGPEAQNNGANMEPPFSGWHAYGFKVFHDYKSHLQSSHLAKIKELGTYLDYDPAVQLMLEVDDLPHAKMQNNMTDEELKTFSPKQDPEDGRQRLQALLSAMNQFYLEVDFDNYLKRSEKYYDAARSQVIKAMPKGRFIEEMEAFYRQEFNSFNLVPGLLIPTGMGFGQRFQSGNSFDIYNVFGALGSQNIAEDNFDMGFTDKRRMMELSIHEFGHSFANPIVDLVPDSIIAQTSHLFEAIKEVMYDQAYHSWTTCLKEHFVRAGEVVISRSLGHEDSAEDLKDHYIRDRKFIYLPQIIEILEQYQQGKYNSYFEAVMAALSSLE